ncbi:bacillithiol biosynthesis deacetylase BshB1 [Paenibacillus albiflavus]|uniref:Bacillithiol biosynthesis deacetylase BshB1 n=1 Tax=Paenibacillus albiflavus TaxID=2545760 RepID=A0A4R4EMU6_9BACL|nr:bacillithiol biosynthesis deacetylase BshB1 [Paenibacillus albiflavus]TCZ81187.1 bacillithiol biosynthesis deacetylase BshB1 [Paenibacillus albiflavus]
MNDKLDILIFGAHPDDAEIGMGGTIAKHTAAGYKVGMCDLTYAEMSSNGDVETRQREAAEASDVLRLHTRINLGLPDRGLSLSAEHIEAVTRAIRLYRPSVVFAPYWQDRHPDHVMCSQIVQEAVFNAKLRKYQPDLPAWIVPKVYFYFINDVYEANVIVDVTTEYEDKRNGLRAYRSQFEPAGSGNEYVATPLNQSYLERVEARDFLVGQKAGFTYAESFVSKNPIHIDYFGK